MHIWNLIVIHGALVSALLTAVMSAATLVKVLGTRRLQRGTTPISVLKPVKGLDDEFEANLESFCRQTHGKYELIVGAVDAEDPALLVAERVRRRFPGVALRIVSGGWPSGHNPKIRNLRNMLTKARYSAILISDGDIRADPNYLSIMAGALERPGVGLVSNLVIGACARNVGAICESLRLNGFVANSMAAAELIARHPIAIGKSMLFSRDALTAAGGLESAADVLAEDYLLGRAVLRSGYRVTTLGFPVWAVNRDWSLAKTLQRHTRWSQIRRHVAPLTYCFEPLAIPELWLALLGIVLCASAHTPGMTAAFAAVSLSWTLSTIAARVLQGSNFSYWALLLQPLSATLGLLAWLRAWSLDIVVWRGQTYRIGAGSRLSVVQPPRATSARRERIAEAA